MNSEKKYYTIGDISDICNVPIKTLRYYDEIKLLVPSHRDSETNYRYYSEDQMLTLYIIRRLKGFGFTLEEIRSMVYGSAIKAQVEQLEKKAKSLEKEIKDMQALHHEILFTIDRMKKGSDFLGCFGQNNGLSELIANSDGSKNGYIQTENIKETYCVYTRRTEYNYQNAYVSVARWFEIFDIIKKYNLKSEGVITLTYHNGQLEQFLKTDCDLEVSVPVEAVDESCPYFKLRPAFKAVTAMHVGSHSTIINTHIAALKWINQHNYKIKGPISEEFIISPVDVKNESEYLTKIIIPVE